MRDAFPAGYRQSREAFLARCRAADAVVHSYVHPQPGSDGPAVATDVASFGRRETRRVMIVVSGTHGVEGLCGAGIQLGLLDRNITGLLDGDVRLVLVHALNPHGFLGLHRTNEDNVDLNRNFVAHDGDYPDDTGYSEVHSLLVPEDWDGPARAAADASLDSYVAKRGGRALQAAVSRGQYTHADGLFYGGRAQAWSNGLWRSLLRGHCGSASHVAVVDLHSGLGARGACELISGALAGTTELGAAHQYFGEGLVFPGLDSTAPSGSGYMGLSLVEELPKARSALVVAEFGTEPFDRVFAALRADNWLLAHGADAKPALRSDVRANMEAAFVGRDAAWQHAVLERGVEICRRALAGLADAATAPVGASMHEVET
jgi:hypothetical protein